MVDPLLEQILAAPDDDEPRRVYADFLQQRGDPRGEFIAVQIAMSSEPHGSERRSELLRRARVLEQQHLSEWLPQTPRSYTFERGFLVELSASTHWLTEHGAALFDREPVKRLSIDFSQPMRDVSELLAAPLPQTLVDFDCSYQPLRGDALGRLLSASFTHRLQALSFNTASIDDDGLRALSARPRIASLKSLSLNGNQLGARGAIALGGSSLLRTLTRLSVANNRIDPDGATALLSSPGLPTLTMLDLTANPVGFEGIAALAGSKAAKTLQVLSLAECGVGDESIALLASRFPALQTVDLRANGLRNPSADALLELGRRQVVVNLVQSTLYNEREEQMENVFSWDVVAKLRDVFGDGMHYR